jgi:hypothetical protein
MQGPLDVVDDPMIDSEASARQSLPIKAVQSFSGTYNDIHRHQYSMYYGPTSLNIIQGVVIYLDYPVSDR